MWIRNTHEASTPHRKNYNRRLRNAESWRGKGTPADYTVVSHENIHMSNIKQPEQIVFTSSGARTHAHMHRRVQTHTYVSTIKGKVINLNGTAWEGLER